MNPLIEKAYKQFASSMPWLMDRTVFLTRHGSHAYGLNTATSDEDFKGFCVATWDYYLGYLKKFEQAECKDPDCVIYDIRKFFNLAADCNPSIIEVLYTDQSDWVLVSPIFKEIAGARDLFLSQKAQHTFSGYALSQLKRIKRHYEWLHNPPKEEPTRAKFKLPEHTVIPADQRAAVAAAVQGKLAEWDGLMDFDPLDQASVVAIRNKISTYVEQITLGCNDAIWTAAARTIGVPDNFIEAMQMERSYNKAREEWNQYQNWKKTRNPARAELEAKYGYDTKHGMHLVRLMRMGAEILTTGKVIVKRPDRDELLAIRNGEWSYEKLIDYAEKMDIFLDEAAAKSPLPKSPNRAKLDGLCQKLTSIALQAPSHLKPDVV